MRFIKKENTENQEKIKITINKKEIRNIAEHSRNYKVFLLEMKEVLIYKKIANPGTVYYGDKEHKKLESMIFEEMTNVFPITGIEKNIIKNNFDKFLYRSKNEEQIEKALIAYKELENIMDDLDIIERKMLEKEEEVWRIWDNG